MTDWHNTQLLHLNQLNLNPKVLPPNTPKSPSVSSIPSAIGQDSHIPTIITPADKKMSPSQQRSFGLAVQSRSSCQDQHASAGTHSRQRRLPSKKLSNISSWASSIVIQEAIQHFIMGLIHCHPRSYPTFHHGPHPLSSKKLSNISSWASSIVIQEAIQHFIMGLIHCHPRSYPTFHHRPHPLSSKKLSNISSWASSIVICDCKSPVYAVSNANSADSSVIQLQAATALLDMPKSILTVWAPGHCGLSGNELADHHLAKLGAAETQPDNTHEPASRRALIISRFCRPPPILLERLKEVYTCLHDEQINTSFVKTERTDLAGFHSGHHPALRRWQQLVGINEDSACRLCGEEVEYAEHVWLRCSAHLVERHHSDHGHWPAATPTTTTAVKSDT